MIAVECTRRRRAALPPAAGAPSSRKVTRYALPCSAAVHVRSDTAETSHSRARRRVCKAA